MWFRLFPLSGLKHPNQAKLILSATLCSAAINKEWNQLISRLVSLYWFLFLFVRDHVLGGEPQCLWLIIWVRSYKNCTEKIWQPHSFSSPDEHLFTKYLLVDNLSITPQNPHAGSTGSHPGPALWELPLGPPQTRRQVVLPWLHSASFSCVRTCLSACFSAPPPPQTANLLLSHLGYIQQELNRLRNTTNTQTEPWQTWNNRMIMISIYFWIVTHYVACKLHW